LFHSLPLIVASLQGRVKFSFIPIFIYDNNLKKTLKQTAAYFHYKYFRGKIMKNIAVRYAFVLPDKSTKEYVVKIDAQTLRMTNVRTVDLPDWTALKHQQCPHCPLDETSEPHCPIAVGLVDLVDLFGPLLSIDRIKVTVTTEERKVFKETDTQTALSSLMELVMTTSKCPLLDFFKPMARFHLPFASADETIWRAVSSFFTSQYFLYKKGHVPDLEMDGLVKIFENTSKLNKAMVRRIRSVSESDSALNALVTLDMMALSLPFSIKAGLSEFSYLYSGVPTLNQKVPITI
jgi:hypothetical protein